MTDASLDAADSASPWQLPIRDGEVPRAVAAAITATMTRLDVGLSRWVGISGYCTVLQRALSLTQEQFPWLVSFPCPRGDETMLAAASETLGSAAVATGVNALISNLVDVLGRIIGEEMAIRLVEQACTPNPREVVETDTEN